MMALSWRSASPVLFWALTGRALSAGCARIVALRCTAIGNRYCAGTMRRGCRRLYAVCQPRCSGEQLLLHAPLGQEPSDFRSSGVLPAAIALYARPARGMPFAPRAEEQAIMVCARQAMRMYRNPEERCTPLSCELSLPTSGGEVEGQIVGQLSSRFASRSSVGVNCNWFVDIQLYSVIS